MALDSGYVEVRLTAEGLERLYQSGEQIEVLTPSRRRPSFQIPTNLPRQFRYTEIFQDILRQGQVRAVDHGEFQACADKLIDVCGKSDRGLYRPPAISIQRCRRGGKTFMSYAVAAVLEKYYEENDQGPFVIFISLNSTTRLSESETAQGAILCRIAYELVRDQKKGPFHSFRKQYQDFDAVADWIVENKVILLIDELNVVLPTAEDFETMSLFLDDLVGREGSALLYTTHHKIDPDLLRDREREGAPFLSLRTHSWQAIPRFNSLSCIRHMGRPESFWSAVLRGRIPALLVLPQEDIRNFLPRLSVKDSST